MSPDAFVPASEHYDPVSGTRQQRLGDYGGGSDVDLSRLTRKQRHAYVAVRMNDVPVDEHADAVGIQRATVLRMLQRAETKLGER